MHGGDLAAVIVTASNFTSNGPLLVVPAGASAPDELFTSVGAGLDVIGQQASADHPINVTIAGCRFSGNVAATLGGGFAANQWGKDAARIDVTGSEFTNNTVRLLQHSTAHHSAARVSPAGPPASVRTRRDSSSSASRRPCHQHTAHACACFARRAGSL